MNDGRNSARSGACRGAFDDDAPTLVFGSSGSGQPRGLGGGATSRRGATRTHDDDGLWDANDVARYLKVSRSWVYHRAEAGLFPYVRVGGLLRFEPHAVRAFASGGAGPLARHPSKR